MARRSSLASLPFLLAAGISLLPLPAPAAAPAPAPVVLVARVHSIIHPVIADFLREAIERADREGAAAVVIELDTPGGLMTSTHEITRAMLSARTPVVVYVGPSGAEAASAGFFILMAADVAAMAPGTYAGSAHPVGPQGETVEGTMGQKLEKSAAASVRALAVRSGRNVALAEGAVTESRSFTAQEALASHLVEVVAPGLPELLRAIDGRPVRKGSGARLAIAGAALREVEMSPWRSLLAALAHPDLAYLLLTLGGLGLFFELMHPGAVLPGVLGALFLILAFFGLSVLPVNYAGVGLILLALVLFIAELKLATHGMLTLAGVASLVLGSLMLFEGGELSLRVRLEWIVTLALFSLAVMGFLSGMALRARRLPVRTGSEGLISERGTARSSLVPDGPHGKVFVHGELWDAEAVQPVAPGEPVEVVAVRGMTLAVRPLGGGHAAGSA